MARFRNVHGEDRVCPWIGGVMVAAGETVEVPDDQYENWVASGWEPLDPEPTSDQAQAAEPEQKAS